MIIGSTKYHGTIPITRLKFNDFNMILLIACYTYCTYMNFKPVITYELCPYANYLSIVLDLVSQVRDVVLMECIFGSGRPQGVGILE